MTRRGLLLGGAAVPFAQTNNKGLLKGHHLAAGSTVGLITPSTFVSDPDRLALAERTVKYFGLQFKMGDNVRKREGYVGGSVAERVADLHAMFRDRTVDAVFAIRGGFGSAHLLDSIDYDLIARNPKIFLGYSDITALHLAIHQKTGLMTFHGPVTLSKFTGFTQEHFHKALFETKPLGVVTNPSDTDTLRPAHTLRTVHPGKASGRLIGGNLSLICSLMGTPYEIDTRGKILFMEDVDEQPYSIDRMLTQLRLAGKLQAAAGIIWGECLDCRPRDYKPAFDATFTTGEVIDRILGQLRVPVLSGLTIGHTDDQLTLPIGAMASLDASSGELNIEEPALT